MSVFQGVTRDNFEGKTVTHLSYECYESMALKQMNAIANALVQKFSLHGIAMQHRIGEVPPKECSVQIVAVSAHRKAAIEAVAEAIDTLKA